MRYPRDRVDNEFKGFLRHMRPSKEVAGLARDMVQDCWKRKKGEHAQMLSDLDRQKKDMDQAVTRITARLLETDDRTLVSVYEKQIKELETQRQLLSAQAAEAFQTDTSFEGALGTVFDFIENPLSIWDNGDLDDKRLVLNLAFAKQVAFDRQTGFGTALTSLPFRVFQDLKAGKYKMVVH